MIPKCIMTPGDRDMVERLGTLVACAIAITNGDPSADTVDEHALLAELSSVVEESIERADEMVPVIERLEDILRAALAGLSDDSKLAAARYSSSLVKWQQALPVMPRPTTAFVACDRLHNALERRRYQLAQARYEALRAPDDRCDCAPRMAASFLSSRPTGPLVLIDSSGVPYAAMNYLWQCGACGMKWFEEEGHDDMGADSSWQPAASDASKA